MLRFAINVENCLCMYRNFYFYGKFGRALVLARILMELSIVVSFTAMYFYHYKNEPIINYIIFVLLYTISTILIILSWYNSCMFKKLLYHLNSNSQYLKLNNLYKKNIEREQLKMKSIIILIVLWEISTVIYNWISPWDFSLHTHSYGYLLKIVGLYGSVVALRYKLEYLVISLVLAVIAVQLEGLMHCIDKQKSTTTSHESSDNVSPTSRLCHQKRIQQWSVIYIHAAESSKLLNSIFGTQLTFMVTTAVTFYVVMLYSLAALNMQGQGSPLSFNLQFIQVIIQAIIYFYTLASTAQKAQNKVKDLKRQLCKLLIGTIKCKIEYKAIRDLLRLVMTQPIRMKAFGSIDINMSLLPTLISLITGYTVIALQFNNVV